MALTTNELMLIECVVKNDLSKAKKYAECCLNEDKTQKNHYQVTRITNLLKSQGMNLLELPSNISSFSRMEDLSIGYNENRYYLSEKEKELFKLIKKMNDVSLKLMEKQIPYVNATLLYGESGTGKTAFSRYVAYKLELPYLYINFSQMIDSYMGNTSKNLTNLFNFVNQQKCVVMLDEIDCVATKRKYGSSGADAEISRTVTTLLLMLDSITNDHVIIGATNLINDIDEAVLRRFTQKHELKRLDEINNKRFIRQYLDDIDIKYNEYELAKYAKNQSQAEIMTHITRAIADMYINEEEKIKL